MHIHLLLIVNGQLPICNLYTASNIILYKNITNSKNIVNNTIIYDKYTNGLNN